MADKKQYITQVNENGQIFISEDVISTIAYRALQEVEGFGALIARNNADFSMPLNAKNWHRGMRIDITEKGNVLVEMNILIKYGTNIVNVAKQIQDSVSNTIGSTIGLYPKRVNVNICGIVRK